MLEIMQSPPNVLAIKVAGKLQKSDYTDVLQPAVKKMLDEHGELRAAIVVGDEFDGLSAGAFWEDMRLGFEHVTKWEKCGVVTNKDWVRHGVAIFGWMIPGDVKVFDIDKVDDGIAWAAA
jgi:hypothetical protein